MIKILSWNIARSDECWEEVLKSDYDIALLQEVHEPKMTISDDILINPGEWKTAGYSKRNWRTAIVKLSDRVNIEWINCKSIEDAKEDDLAVSRTGTLAVAKITSIDGGDPLIIVSCYTVWEKPTIVTAKSDEIYSDASAHRLISDITGLMGAQRKHRILLAGDFNILNRYGEHSNRHWADRYSSVFDRFKAIGIPFVGPSFPNGRQAKPWPEELPKDSTCVPTYYHSKQTPETATRQLDFVFASKCIDISVQALNGIEEWGPSDHCKLEIKVL